jgi:hypothetical protein
LVLSGPKSNLASNGSFLLIQRKRPGAKLAQEGDLTGRLLQSEPLFSPEASNSKSRQVNAAAENLR